jgi:hypothetical protein
LGTGGGAGFLDKAGGVETYGERAGGSAGEKARWERNAPSQGFLAQEGGKDGQQNEITSFRILTSPLCVEYRLVTPVLVVVKLILVTKNPNVGTQNSNNMLPLCDACRSWPGCPLPADGTHEQENHYEQS